MQDHRCEASRIQLAKQDLPSAERIDRVFYPAASDLADGGFCGVFGEKAMLKLDSGGGDASVRATFGDGSPALLRLARGAAGGAVWIAAFHPGLSYFHPALPADRPTDKGSTDANCESTFAG